MTVAQVSLDSLDVEVYAVPTDVDPEGDGTLTWSKTTMVLVHARGGGQEGLGWTYAGESSKPVVTGQLAGAVVGRDALDVPGSLEAMVRACRNLGRPGVVATAISAVEVALHDLKARLLDVPLASLLGRACPAVPVYGSGGFTTYDDNQLTTQLEWWLALGLPRVKIKIGESWGTRVERDLARVALVRRVVGPDVEVYVDANGGYTRKQAIRVAHAMAEHDVVWFEEPVSSDDLAGLREVRDAVRCDVAAGEYGYDLPYFHRMTTAGAVDCLQVDVTRCGGMLEWQRAAAVAGSQGLQVSGHCAPSLHVAVAGSVPNLRHLEFFHDHVRIESLFFDGALTPVDGALVPDLSRPGLGLTLKAADAEPYRVA